MKYRVAPVVEDVLANLRYQNCPQHDTKIPSCLGTVPYVVVELLNEGAEDKSKTSKLSIKLRL